MRDCHLVPLLPWRQDPGMSANLQAIAAMTASMLLFAVGDALMKVAGSTLPVGEMIFVRGLFATLLILAIARFRFVR